jgi:hypothetical protein
VKGGSHCSVLARKGKCGGLGRAGHVLLDANGMFTSANPIVMMAELQLHTDRATGRKRRGGAVGCGVGAAGRVSF